MHFQILIFKCIFYKFRIYIWKGFHKWLSLFSSFLLLYENLKGNIFGIQMPECLTDKWLIYIHWRKRFVSCVLFILVKYTRSFISAWSLPFQWLPSIQTSAHKTLWVVRRFSKADVYFDTNKTTPDCDICHQSTICLEFTYYSQNRDNIDSLMLNLYKYPHAYKNDKTQFQKWTCFLFVFSSDVLFILVLFLSLWF